MRLDAVDVDDEAFLELRLATHGRCWLEVLCVRTSSSKSSPTVEAAILELT